MWLPGVSGGDCRSLAELVPTALPWAALLKSLPLLGLALFLLLTLVGSCCSSTIRRGGDSKAKQRFSGCRTRHRVRGLAGLSQTSSHSPPVVFALQSPLWSWGIGLRWFLAISGAATEDHAAQLGHRIKGDPCRQKRCLCAARRFFFCKCLMAAHSAKNGDK